MTPHPEPPIDLLQLAEMHEKHRLELGKLAALKAANQARLDSSKRELLRRKIERQQAVVARHKAAIYAVMPEGAPEKELVGYSKERGLQDYVDFFNFNIPLEAARVIVRKRIPGVRQSTARVCDLGCGNGKMLHELKHSSIGGRIETHGADIEPPSQKYAESFTYIPGDVLDPQSHFAMSAGEYDLMFSRKGVKFSSDPDRAFGQISSVVLDKLSPKYGVALLQLSSEMLRPGEKGQTRLEELVSKINGKKVFAAQPYQLQELEKAGGKLRKKRAVFVKIYRIRES